MSYLTALRLPLKSKAKKVQKRKFEIKAKKNWPEKALFYGAPKLGSSNQIAWIFFLQNIHLITKYLLPQKIGLLTSPLRLAKGPAF